MDYGASFFMEVSDNTVRLAIGAGVGVVLAVLVFVSYKVGILFWEQDLAWELPFMFFTRQLL